MRLMLSIRGYIIFDNRKIFHLIYVPSRWLNGVCQKIWINSPPIKPLIINTKITYPFLDKSKNSVLCNITLILKIILSTKIVIKMFLTRTGNCASLQTTCYKFWIVRFIWYVCQDIIIRDMEEYHLKYYDNVNETKNVNMWLQFQNSTQYDNNL